MTEEKEPRVKEVIKSDFQQWKHHPVSKLFFELLRDKKEFIKTLAMSQWLDGDLKSTEPDQVLRGQIIELQSIEDLTFESIVQFYGTETN